MVVVQGVSSVADGTRLIGCAGSVMFQVASTRCSTRRMREGSTSARWKARLPRWYAEASPACSASPS